MAGMRPLPCALLTPSPKAGLEDDGWLRSRPFDASDPFHPFTPGSGFAFDITV